MVPNSQWKEVCEASEVMGYTKACSRVTGKKNKTRWKILALSWVRSYYRFRWRSIEVGYRDGGFQTNYKALLIIQILYRWGEKWTRLQSPSTLVIECIIYLHKLESHCKHRRTFTRAFIILEFGWLVYHQLHTLLSCQLVAEYLPTMAFHAT